MITVEQLRHAIEDDQQEYPEFEERVESKWHPNGFVMVGPNNGTGWDEAAYASELKVVIDGVLHVGTLVNETGGMDEGSHASRTWQFGDQFFRKNGYYQSHYGHDWDGTLEEVRPVQKVVTVFE